jgi:hypothetical protein
LRQRGSANEHGCEQSDQAHHHLPVLDMRIIARR